LEKTVGKTSSYKIKIDFIINKAQIMTIVFSEENCLTSAKGKHLLGEKKIKSFLKILLFCEKRQE